MKLLSKKTIEAKEEPKDIKNEQMQKKSTLGMFNKINDSMKASSHLIKYYRKNKMTN